MNLFEIEKVCPYFVGEWGKTGICGIASGYDKSSLKVARDCNPKDQHDLIDFQLTNRGVGIGFNYTEDGEARLLMGPALLGISFNARDLYGGNMSFCPQVSTTAIVNRRLESLK